MTNASDKKQEQSKGKRLYYMIAFAFGLGAAFGTAVSTWITAMLAH